ncbi:bifunctional phosphopantothenoylcysteine decarboxylase/phosphopantothenate--cysteine ligase CoaBC [Sediminitomix flava]|uniref:Coenzyme A biosynthesis bifunctional protein CoaBC n=1 Tax=Sediminitomix flava TaxID=379075 RepID=A0A315ZDL6_SEDFL|nr:bifunctional phosphopantothenoylcysteine decarboxylase/phosphopantothenate--cysteine ligase CoaBC [Sediminitomix flava]PWJ42814.1 phosphopantothenate-cysteine ligase /phosphopantothenoylcysteine decarboxylase [Sediminitomix flava]
MLKGKKILLGVTGSIAAYKAALLVRLLKKEGAEVQVLITEAAKEFITPLTLSTLSENPVLSDFTKGKTGEWNSHVKLGLWADLMVIAPASAQTMAKMTSGLCDNLLTAVYLSARCPVMVAPAMDLDMYLHPSTTRNINTLVEYGHHIIEAEEGELASGLVGKGRMAEPEHILTHIQDFFRPKGALKGKKVVLTAGPTKEFIDPVRYLTNASSGKMGYAIAQEFINAGAEVTLISGPVELTPPAQLGQFVAVNTAEEMYEQTKKYFLESDIAVFTAAVADYSPEVAEEQKIKKTGDTMSLQLRKTKDIAKEMGILKKPHQITIGFALETNDELENASAKLEKKNFDFVVLNSLQDKGAGFGHDTNKITIVETEGKTTFGLKSKKEVAKDIVNHLISKLS